MLSLNTLNALRCIAETGSFAAAARQLGMTQPSVSQHVRKLEQEYSETLFCAQQWPVNSDSVLPTCM